MHAISPAGFIIAKMTQFSLIVELDGADHAIAAVTCEHIRGTVVFATNKNLCILIISVNISNLNTTNKPLLETTKNLWYT